MMYGGHARADEELRGRHGLAVQPAQKVSPGEIFAESHPSECSEPEPAYLVGRAATPDPDPRLQATLVPHRFHREPAGGRNVIPHAVDLERHARFVLAMSHAVRQEVAVQIRGLGRGTDVP